MLKRKNMIHKTMTFKCCKDLFFPEKAVRFIKFDRKISEQVTYKGFDETTEEFV